jgi:hypothetical protein
MAGNNTVHACPTASGSCLAGGLSHFATHPPHNVPLNGQPQKAPKRPLLLLVVVPDAL